METTPVYEKVPRRRDTFWKMLLHKWIATLVFVFLLVIFFTCIAIYCDKDTQNQITDFFDELTKSVVKILEAIFK